MEPYKNKTIITNLSKENMIKTRKRNYDWNLISQAKWGNRKWLGPAHSRFFQSIHLQTLWNMSFHKNHKLWFLSQHALLLDVGTPLKKQHASHKIKCWGLTHFIFGFASISLRCCWIPIIFQNSRYYHKSIRYWYDHESIKYSHITQILY